MARQLCHAHTRRCVRQRLPSMVRRGRAAAVRGPCGGRIAGQATRQNPPARPSRPAHSPLQVVRRRACKRPQGLRRRQGAAHHSSRSHACPAARWRVAHGCCTRARRRRHHRRAEGSLDCGAAPHVGIVGVPAAAQLRQGIQGAAHGRAGPIILRGGGRGQRVAGLGCRCVGVRGGGRACSDACQPRSASRPPVPVLITPPKTRHAPAKGS
mmetsp:Transcript_1227/g.3903  ORF Transcript_1227/g.3903 Transcript_1227/m.3903 type:complete len:211 (+) Transcript_1227:1211-1843(+)